MSIDNPLSGANAAKTSGEKVQVSLEQSAWGNGSAHLQTVARTGLMEFHHTRRLKDAIRPFLLDGMTVPRIIEFSATISNAIGGPDEQANAAASRLRGTKAEPAGGTSDLLKCPKLMPRAPLCYVMLWPV
jgi:hypothetical protein